MTFTNIVVCDGGKRNHMTYGSFKLFDLDGKLLAHHYFFFGYGTSNTAEYLALLNSMDFCLRNDYKSVLFKSDSNLVVKQVNGSYRVSKDAEHLKNLRDVVRQKMKAFDSIDIIKIDGKLVKKILGH